MDGDRRHGGAARRARTREIDPQWVQAREVALAADLDPDGSEDQLLDMGRGRRALGGNELDVAVAGRALIAQQGPVEAGELVHAERAMASARVMHGDGVTRNQRLGGQRRADGGSYPDLTGAEDRVGIRVGAVVVAARILAADGPDIGFDRDAQEHRVANGDTGRGNREYARAGGRRRHEGADMLHEGDRGSCRSGAEQGDREYQGTRPTGGAGGQRDRRQDVWAKSPWKDRKNVP